MTPRAVVQIYLAIKNGEIPQPFTVSDCREFTLLRVWDVTETYLKVVLANSEKDRVHSGTYKDYFIRVSEGKCRINHSIRV